MGEVPEARRGRLLICCELYRGLTASARGLHAFMRKPLEEAPLHTAAAEPVRVLRLSILCCKKDPGTPGETGGRGRPCALAFETFVFRKSQMPLPCGL